MGVRVSGPQVVAFLEWLHRNGVRYGMDVLENHIADFTAEYLHSDPHGYLESDEFYQREMRRQLAEAIEYRTDYRSNSESYEFKGDLVRRYATVPFRSVFLYTSQDQEFRQYLTEHWKAWHDESGDTFDFYDYAIGLGDHRSNKSTYTFAREFIHTLRAIPGADLDLITQCGLPCMLIWSNNDFALVPFADTVGNPSHIRDRFRLVASSLRAHRLDGLRAAFESRSPEREADHSDVFLSYRSLDREWVEPFCAALRQHGVNVWYDRDLHAGDRFDLRISHHLKHARVAVVVWSKVAVESGYVLAEALMAYNEEKLAPVARERTVPIPVPFNALHTEDLSSWPAEHHGFDSLLRRLPTRTSR